ncbi:IucA/IucC family protein [Streptomyces sparsogenes]|uniref:IucA/IucC family protein n=1 Tax=Streptomyces sparsogenes TaxID=67365 RepID=UPI0033EA5EA3
MPAPDMPHSPGEPRPQLPPAPWPAAVPTRTEESAAVPRQGRRVDDTPGGRAPADRPDPLADAPRAMLPDAPDAPLHHPKPLTHPAALHHPKPPAHPDAPAQADPLGHLDPLGHADPLGHTDLLGRLDPWDHPDPWTAADACATENLLRCWVRESGAVSHAPGHRTLRIPLPAAGTALSVPVRHWSATGWHRFGRPVLDGGAQDAPALDAVTLAALLGREMAHGAEWPGAPARITELVGRVADSVRRTAQFLSRRRAAPADPVTDTPFLAAEQSLLLGHPLHPTPKSREGFSDAESPVFSPESRGSFPLHWIAVDTSVLACDSAWTERGRTVPAERLALSIAGPDPERPPGTVPLPLHPWQAREIRYRPDVAALFDAGLLHDLGPAGEHWHPTSSLRTVYRTGAPVMLKLSLAVRITNSRRENLRKELRRGVEMHRLLRSGLSGQWRAACPGRPGFDVVRDPAWLAVDKPDGTPLSGLDVVIRHNPFGPGDEAVCLAGLTSPRPWADRRTMCSRLARIIARIAARTGRRPATVSVEWFLRYLHTVVRPVLWLDGEAGIALEAHQQNTLVLLDPDGWPAGGRYRDNQGYYFRESRRPDLERRLPGLGAHSDTFVLDEVADERFAYYLGVNNILGLIGAFGSERLADERLLLAALRRFLAEAASGPAKTRSTLPSRLLETPTLRCKANLLTRLRGLDELVGPVDTQSVYVTIANPLSRPVTA